MRLTMFGNKKRADINQELHRLTIELGVYPEAGINWLTVRLMNKTNDEHIATAQISVDHLFEKMVESMGREQMRKLLGV